MGTCGFKNRILELWRADLSAADCDDEEELVAIVQRLIHVIGRNFLPINEKPHLESRIALFII